jgi:hypothetical protein
VLERALRWIREQLAFLVVLIVLAGAFGYLFIERTQWRRATVIVAAALLLAGVLRAVLPTRHAGMLATRSRWLDALAYLVLGGLVLAADIRLHS